MNKITFILLLISSSCCASIYEIGSTKAYVSPNALYQAGVIENGDTILIDAELYSGTASLAVWQNDNLLIRGVGGKPHLEADGEYIWGKGIWVLAGNNITVENITFSGAMVPDKNGAGIRLDGVGLTVRHCNFHDNENGILTSNPYEGDILIEYSEFDNSGAGDGFSHNVYVGHVNKLTFRFNYSHHANIGHALKSRANENYILYNRIMDEEDGHSSRLIDLSNGGFSIVMGNLLMQGMDAENVNLLGYGREGLTNTKSELYFINNTAVNRKTSNGLFIDIEPGTNIVNITNNIFAGEGTVVNGSTTTMTNNLIDSEIEDILFIDEPNYDYQIYSNSSAVDMGTNVDSVDGYSLTPEFEYEHPTYFRNREISNSIIDIGAYEYTWITSINESQEEDIIAYPNPFFDKITIREKDINESELSLFSIAGEDVSNNISIQSQDENTMIETSRLTKGIYFLRIKSRIVLMYKY